MMGRQWHQLNHMQAICTLSLQEITTPAPHQSDFYGQDALPDTQPTASKHWRPKHWHLIIQKTGNAKRQRQTTWHTELYFIQQIIQCLAIWEKQTKTSVLLTLLFNLFLVYTLFPKWPISQYATSSMTDGKMSFALSSAFHCRWFYTRQPCCYLPH